MPEPHLTSPALTQNRIAQAQVIVFKVAEGSPLFLLLKRTPERGGFWQPVTGGIQEGEGFLEAAKRELLEETGIDEVKKWFEDVHSFEFEFNGGHGWTKEHVFAAQVSPEAEAVMSDEHSQMKWCGLEEALELLKYESNKEGFRKLAERLPKPV